MKQLILASGSPRRKELLQQIGMEFQVIPSKKEEVITGTIPSEVVQELAKQKAEDIADNLKQTGIIVLGADTVVALGQQIMGKPANEAEALEMLKQLQNNTHQVYTGVALCTWNQDGTFDTKTFYEVTDVQIYPMTEEEIRSYIASGDPMDKAGSYGIQGAFAAFIKGIVGDYNNVVGLPIGRVYQELKKFSI